MIKVLFEHNVMAQLSAQIRFWQSWPGLWLLLGFGFLFSIWHASCSEKSVVPLKMFTP